MLNAMLYISWVIEHVMLNRNVTHVNVNLREEVKLL